MSCVEKEYSEWRDIKMSVPGNEISTENIQGLWSLDTITEKIAQ